jgi:hypothetical protein
MSPGKVCDMSTRLADDRHDGSFFPRVAAIPRGHGICGNA